MFLGSLKKKIKKCGDRVIPSKLHAGVQERENMVSFSDEFSDFNEKCLLHQSELFKLPQLV